MKYELVTSDQIDYLGLTLTRIRALVDITKFGVRVGDLGGYIEKEANLSQDGNAWVAGNARVYGNARVFGNARVNGNALVSE